MMAFAEVEHRNQIALDAPMGSSLQSRHDSDCHFPMKLHKMLENIEAEGLESVVSWTEDGRSFAIRNLHKFSSDVMPRYFSRQTKYKSFQRQLNLYNFVRRQEGKNRRIYSHPMFIKSNRQLAESIRREPVRRSPKKLKTGASKFKPIKTNKGLETSKKLSVSGSEYISNSRKVETPSILDSFSMGLVYNMDSAMSSSPNQIDSNPNLLDFTLVDISEKVPLVGDDENESIGTIEQLLQTDVNDFGGISVAI